MMMEKYAANLEIKVDERTAELQIEKQKADQLLYRMLPRAVAEKMKQGQSIRAELFDTVTVYFSDVVSFTNLCSQSTPMEVSTPRSHSLVFWSVHNLGDFIKLFISR